MATMQIETLANDFVEIIAQQVGRELKERLVALEAKTHHFTFKKLDDLQAEVQGLRECNAANLQVMRSQQEKINHLETILARIEVTLVDHMIQEHLSNVDIDYKIERAIEDCDFDDAIKEAVYERIDDEIQSRGLLDEEDLQTFLGQHQYLNENDLIEFLADRVRITVE